VYTNKTQTGFSLAEVLIILVIIGVIASITIPTLQQNINDAQLKTAWKKAYSDISQALNQMKHDQGGNFKESLKPLSLKPALMEYLKVTKNCDNCGCFGAYTKPAFNYKTLSNIPIPNTHLFDDGQFVLNNGMFISIENSAYYHIIWVDINGYQKPPNTIGRDVFGIQVFEDTFKPLGAEGTSVSYYDSVMNTCNTTSDYRSGMGCSAQYLYE